jgi:hypothetical protein
MFDAIPFQLLNRELAEPNTRPVNKVPYTVCEFVAYLHAAPCDKIMMVDESSKSCIQHAWSTWTQRECEVGELSTMKSS